MELVQPKLQQPTARCRAWEVQLGLYHIDTVYFNPDCDAEYVRKSLVEHDGYPEGIKVFLNRG